MSGGRLAALLALHDRLTRTEFRVAGVALAAMLGAYLLEVISRYFFNAPTRWSSDVVQYMLCVCISLALPQVTRDAGHVAITSFLEKLAQVQQARVARAIVLLGTVTLFGTALVFLNLAAEQARQGIETVAVFPIPKWWLTAVVAVGLLDSSVHLLRQALEGTVSAGHELDV